MPELGPEVISPTASVTDEDSSTLSGLVPGRLRQVVDAPIGYVRVITKYFVGNFTNITRIRFVRNVPGVGPNEVGSVAAAFAASFDPEKIRLSAIAWTGHLGILLTTGAGPSYTLYLEYEDVPIV